MSVVVATVSRNFMWVCYLYLTAICCIVEEAEAKAAWSSVQVSQPPECIISIILLCQDFYIHGSALCNKASFVDV